MYWYILRDARTIENKGYAVWLKIVWSRRILLVRHLATKFNVFWDVTPCNMLELHRRFSQTRWLLFFLLLLLLFFLRHYSPLLTLTSDTIFLHCWRSLGTVSVTVLTLFGFAFFQQPHTFLVGGTLQILQSLFPFLYILHLLVCSYSPVSSFCFAGWYIFITAFLTNILNTLFSTVLTVQIYDPKVRMDCLRVQCRDYTEILSWLDRASLW